MNQTQKLARCGLFCALSTGILLMGSLIPALLYCAPLLAMLALLPVRQEYGGKATVLAWIAVSVLSLILAPDKEMALTFAFFGYYPALQPRLNQLSNRGLRVICKLAVCNLTALALYGFLIYVLGLTAVLEEFSTLSRGLTLVFLLMVNVTFLLTDLVLSRFGLLYDIRIKSKRK